MQSNDSRLRSGNCAGKQQLLIADDVEFVPGSQSPQCSPSFIAQLLGQPSEMAQGERVPVPTRTANAPHPRSGTISAKSALRAYVVRSLDEADRRQQQGFGKLFHPEIPKLRLEVLPQQPVLVLWEFVSREGPRWTPRINDICSSLDAGKWCHLSPL